MLKAPYRPQAAGRIAFFFGPVAGAIVSVINLRRFGYALKAKRVFLWTLAATSVLAAVLVVTPDVLGRIIGLAAEISFYKIYSSIQEKEFNEWQAAHPDMQPLSGWGAIGWGFAGLLLFVVIAIIVSVPLGLLFPSILK
jgi:disulfide bond formation protein DsbB